MLTVIIAMSPRLARWASHFLVSVLQTGVSSDGTVAMIRTLPAVSASDTLALPAPTTLSSGAASPGFSSAPITVNGFPRRLAAPWRSTAMAVLPNLSSGASPSRGAIEKCGGCGSIPQTEDRHERLLGDLD